MEQNLNMVGKSWSPVFTNRMDIVTVFHQYPGTVNGMLMYPEQSLHIFCALGDFVFVGATHEDDPPERYFISQGEHLLVNRGHWIGSKLINGPSGVLICGSVFGPGENPLKSEKLPYDHFGKDVWEVVSV